MKKILKFLILSAITLTFNTAFADEITQASLDKIMALSGLNKQVAEYPGAIIAGVEQASSQQGTAIPDQKFNSIKNAVNTSFRSSTILKKIKSDIKNNISELEARELLEWYESPVGRKITQAEEAASKPESLQHMMSMAQSLFSDEERVKIALQIDSLMKSTETASFLHKNTLISVFTAFSTTMSPETSASQIAQLKSTIKSQEQQITENIRQLVVLSLVYSYRDIQVNDVELYTSFLAQATSLKFTSLVTKSMEHNLNMAISEMASKLALDLNEKTTES